MKALKIFLGISLVAMLTSCWDMEDCYYRENYYETGNRPTNGSGTAGFIYDGLAYITMRSWFGRPAYDYVCLRSDDSGDSLKIGMDRFASVDRKKSFEFVGLNFPADSLKEGVTLDETDVGVVFTRRTTKANSAMLHFVKVDKVNCVVVAEWSLEDDFFFKDEVYHYALTDGYLDMKVDPECLAEKLRPGWGTGEYE